MNTRRIKDIFLFNLVMFISLSAIAQKPSKEQMEADKKAYAEAMQKLKEQEAKMSPQAKKEWDSLMNQFGMGEKIENATQTVNNSTATRNGNTSSGLVPAKNNKVIAAIGATPSNATMGAFIGKGNNKVFAAVLPAAKNKANEIYTALKQKGADRDEIGNVATTLWMTGRTQIALCVMAQACSNDATHTDNLTNYAAMLTMMGAPEMAIPILNNLKTKFKKNTTILNNLGQAWFALGEMDKATKYLDSTLLFNAGHPQANETKCMIAESKGNKTAALAHAKNAFKHGVTQQRKDNLVKLGYFPAAADYDNFPPLNKSDDLLQLGGSTMPPFPKSVAECKALAPIWKQFRTDIDQRIKPLQKITEESNKLMAKQLEAQQKQFMNAMNKSVSKPGSVSQGEAMQIVGAPMFAEEMNVKQNIVLQNLQNKKKAALQRLAEFTKGEGEVLRKKYQSAMDKINEKGREVGEGGSVSNAQLCIDAVKASDNFLGPYNTKLENLYTEYLRAEKQLLNELSYSAIYTTYAELVPGINAGLKMQWLRALSLTQNGFNFESVTTYACIDEADVKTGKLTAFKDPNCNINSEFNQTLGVANLGFSIAINCSGMRTSFNALAIGVTLNQDLDHAGFGDSFKNCTVSIGPKISAGGKIGPLEANVSGGAGADIEIDRNGVSDVVVTGSVEVEAGIGPAGASAGAEGRMSLNTGAGSIQGTGIF